MTETALRVDEVGIEYGIHGPFRLKTAYRPIYQRRGDRLEPVAVSGVLAAYRSGKRLSPEEFLREVPASERGAVKDMELALHMRNLVNTDVEGLGLHLCIDAKAGGRRAFDAIQTELAQGAFDPQALICEMPAACGHREELAAELHRMGIRLAIGAFRSGDVDTARLAALRPDMVAIDSRWFHNFCREPAAARLLAPMVAGLHAAGARVMIGGIDTAAALEIALDAGADLLQGGLLGRSALAGTIFDETPGSVAALLARKDNIVSLKHQHG